MTSYTHSSFKWTFNFRIHGFFKVSLTLSSHFDTNFSFKCFLCSQALCFSSLVTLLRLSVAISQRSLLVNVILHLEIWGLISNVFDIDF